MKPPHFPTLLRFRAATLAAALLAAIAGLPAQVLIMKDGRKIPAAGATRSGDKIFLRVSAGGIGGKIAYETGQIASVKLPDSVELAAAYRLLANDKAADALPLLDRTFRLSEPFRGIGEDRWGEAMLLKSGALQDLGRTGPAVETLKALADQDASATAGRIARLRLAALGDIDPSQADELLRLADAESAESNPPALRAEASLLKARILLDREDYEQALRAALNVTIFFFDQRLAVGRAQLIAGECYINMNDQPRAVRAFRDVVVGRPKTAAAAEAQKEISKGGEPFAVIVKSLEKQEKENQSKLAAKPQPDAVAPVSGSVNPR